MMQMLVFRLLFSFDDSVVVVVVFLLRGTKPLPDSIQIISHRWTSTYKIIKLDYGWYKVQ